MMAESLGWLAPAPLWGDGGIGLESNELLQPFLTELMSDQFVTEFLGVMGAQGGASPANLADMAPIVGVGTATAPYRLFQPLSQRYYLVTASLVCRRVGIPDRAVQLLEGRADHFRRAPASGRRRAGLDPGPPAIPGDPPTGKWNAASPGQLADGEDQLPMHAAPVAGFAAPGTTAAAFGMSEPGRRTVHYGYIPTGRRDRMVTALTDSDAVAKLQSVDPTGLENPTLGALWARVILPWGMLQGVLPRVAAAQAAATWHRYRLLLPLHPPRPQRLAAEQPPGRLPRPCRRDQPGGADATALADALASIHVGIRAASSPPDSVPGLPSPVPLPQALHDLVRFADLVSGADIPGPGTDYDLTSYADMSLPPVPPLPASWWASAENGKPTPSTQASLAYLAQAALTEIGAQPYVPKELSGMIKIDPAVPTPGFPPATYIIRTVFEHDPCTPVLSGPGRPFQLARPMDGDAPARKIRIALPDVSNLRQFQRGVAIEMPPSLRRVLDRVTPAMLQGQGLGDDPGVELGMICSFSIQIMWVLSFMVMFLFVISFNIIFWWMAFIKICFPIPVPSEPKDGPPSP